MLNKILQNQKKEALKLAYDRAREKIIDKINLTINDYEHNRKRVITDRKQAKKLIAEEILKTTFDPLICSILIEIIRGCKN